MIRVTVAYAPAPRQVDEVSLTLPAASTVQTAIDASARAARYPGINTEAGCVGVWGRKAPLDQVVREGNRVEIWRPLRVDPKLARRERFGKQGARAAGLFAQRRPGAKPGY
jgi:putative ubiquitin-RnfH superfamily antitoxin RatB of RatAB toxin-antitoxin module